jgi:protoheme IX farnesyltransferase
MGVLMPILLGYLMACVHTSEMLNPKVVWLILGNILAASSSFIFNQVIESKYDRLMDRTKDRPLPSGKVSPALVSIIGTLHFILGFYLLFTQVNSASAMITLYIFVIYVVMYTPLKRITRWNTFFGALSGMLLPLAGWLCLEPTFHWVPIFLGLNVFFWQHPHAHAISVIFAEDYEKGGYRMIPLLDEGFKRTRYSILFHSFFLLPLSLAPIFFDRGGMIYVSFALVAALLVLFRSVGFFKRPQSQSARSLLTSTLLYLPLLIVGAYLDLRF